MYVVRKRGRVPGVFLGVSGVWCLVSFVNPWLSSSLDFWGDIEGPGLARRVAESGV